MDIELQKKLFENYPNLFENAKKTIYESCMAWGITTGDGWFSLIDELCQKLQEIDPGLKFEQIKEKIGLLRVYVNSSFKDPEKRKEISNIIHEIESQSSKICEHCGEPGERKVNSGWITTLCDNCNKKFEESNSE